MKQISNVLMVLSASATPLWAGTDHGFSPLKDSLSRSSKRVEYGYLFLTAGAGSNGMNQYMLNRLGFGGYMSTERIEEAEKKIKENNRTGFYLSAGITAPLSYKPDTAARRNWRLKPVSVSVGRISAMGTLYSGDAFRLIFRGNEPYLGRRLELGGSGLRQFAGNYVVVDFDEAYKKKTGNGQFAIFGFSAGLGQLTAYRNLQLKEGWLYTDSNRNYIEAQYDGSFYNAGTDNLTGVGYGLTGDFTLRWGKPRSFYYVRVMNLGVYYVPDGISMKKDMDAPVRINQSVIGIKSLNSDSWLEDLRDTVNGGLAPDSMNRDAWVVSPFTVVWKLFTPKIHISMDYMALRGYVPRLSLAPAKGIWNYRRLRLSPEFQLGGFDNYNFNLGLQYTVVRTEGQAARKQIGFLLRFQGLEGWILPRKDHGAGLVFNLSYSLW